MLIFCSTSTRSITCNRRQNKRIFHECEVLIEKSVSRVTVWHHEALPSDAKLYPRDRFLDQYLTLMIDSFSCTPMGINMNKNQIYLEIFCIHISHFDFDVIL